jgi:hypothetical protein
VDVRVLLDSEGNAEKVMIDTYMDRADAATGYQPTPRAVPDYGSLLYYRGNWYVSMIDRMVAEAKDNLALHISLSHLRHRAAMAWRQP